MISMALVTIVSVFVAVETEKGHLRRPAAEKPAGGVG